MNFAKLKIAAALLLLVAVAGSGAGFFVYGPGESTAPMQEPEKIAQKGDQKKADKLRPPAPDAPQAAAPPAATKKNRTEELIKNLRSPVEFPGIDDPKTTFQDALQFLEKTYELAFDIDEPAFRDAGYTDKSVLLEPVAAQPLPPMRSVSQATLLRKILSRITTPPGKEATYLMRPDHILITTRDKAWNKIFPSRATSEILPAHVTDVVVVQLNLDRRPIGEALLELTASEGLNIVIDPRADEKAKTPVSATLLNVPADTAICVLADMADLQPAFLDNVIYLTTKENAKRLEQETKKRPASPYPVP